MTAATSTHESTGHPRSVLRGAAEVLAVAVVATVALALLLALLVDASDEFLPLQAGPVAVAAAVGVLVGLGLLLLLRRLGRGRLFTPLVVVGTLLSLGGPLSLLSATDAQQPGVSDAAALALIPLHLLVGALVAVLLPRRTRA